MCAATGKSTRQQRIAAAKEEAAKLKKQIEDRKAKLFTGSLKGLKHKPMPVTGLNLRKILRGHYGKVYAVDWAGVDDTLLSASQDGKLLVWNGPAGSKQQVIPLQSTWVMTCCYEHQESRLVACGGLDNKCSIYVVGTTSVKPEKELSHHEGYISCCKFIGPSQLVTASGDSTCVLWDVETATPKQVFADHGGDAMDAAVNPKDPNMFVSSSCDTTCKVWDIRSGKCTQTFVGHETDVNTVKFMGNGLAFGSGSDDSSCKLFDLRSYAQVNDFQDVTPGLSPGITSIDFSSSGRVLFAGYDDNSCKAWDTLEATAEAPTFELDHHKNRVSTVALNRSGMALCLGSWDAELTIWA